MHEDEVRATASQVSRLVRGQCPRWADLPVTPLPGDVEGTDHVLFRVGDELVARMPKIASAVGQVESDARWLPVVAPHLPVIVPVPAFVGEPGAGFPWRWSLVPWIPGGTPPRLGCDDVRLAEDLAAFARALHSVAADDGPRKPPGTRGSALVHADPAARAALSRLAEHDEGFDVAAAGSAWDLCLQAPDWDQPPVWIHGDLQPGNLLRMGARPGPDRHRLLPAHLPADG
jgi:aminoglycoside phosphotransferase (APT) family kinase protein